jgi:Predicted phosphatase homologous to the C-terminal domain of histone macroH2A1
MITVKQNSDITEATSGIIIHGCNCRGVMGGGVAKALRDKFPEIYGPYKNMCDVGKERLLGSVQFVKINDDLTIGNMFTQVDLGYGGKFASVEAIRSCLETVAQYGAEYTNSEPLTIHTPLIGALRGGLDWETEVYPVFVDINNKYDGIHFVIHTYEEKT